MASENFSKGSLLGTLPSICAAILYQGDPAAMQYLEYLINLETFIQYAGAPGMFLHINGDFLIGKLKLSFLS